MDFGTLLHAAQRNERSSKKEPVRCYRATFDPPKKEVRDSKSLSANIQKFLARKEEEEKRKEIEAEKRRAELLALRSQDGKAKKRVAAMLKRTKAANKSVIDDAVDNENTAVTLGGPAQPDEDDYGYVSQEASAFYAKLMDKYQAAPPEEPLFPQKPSKGVIKDLNSTKDRVRNALLKAEEEEMMPHKRKRKSKDKGGKQDDDGDETINYATSDRRDLEYDETEESSTREEPKRKQESKPLKPRRPAPPPLDFNELLRIAEQKQFEPVTKPEAVVKAKTGDEPDRPMTEKQKIEYMRELEARKRRQERDIARQKALNARMRGSESRSKAATSDTDGERTSKSQNLRIPKVNRDDSASDSSGGAEMSEDRVRKTSEGERWEERQRIPKMSESERREERLKIPKLSDSERREDGARIPKITEGNRKDERVRIPKVSDGERQYDERARIPKLSDGDRRYDERVRIPKLSDGERLYDERARIPKLSDVERRYDERASIRKLSDDDRRYNDRTRITKVSDDERARIRKLSDDDRRYDDRTRITKVSDDDRRYDERARKTKLSDDDRFYDERARVPKLYDDERRYDERARAPKLSDDDRHYDDRARMPKRSDGERRYDERARIPKLSEVERRDERPKIPKLSESEKRDDRSRINKLSETDRRDERPKVTKLSESERKEEKYAATKMAENDRREGKLNGGYSKTASTMDRMERKMSHGSNQLAQSVTGERHNSQAKISRESESYREERERQNAKRENFSKSESSVVPQQKLSKGASSEALTARSSLQKSADVKKSTDRSLEQAKHFTSQPNISTKSNSVEERRNSSTVKNSSTLSGRKLHETNGVKFQAKKSTTYDTDKPKRSDSRKNDVDLFGDADIPVRSGGNSASKMPNFPRTASELERRNGEQKNISKPAASQKPSISPAGSKIQSKSASVARPISKEQRPAFKEQKFNIAGKDNQPSQPSGSKSIEGPHQNSKLKPGQQSDVRPKQIPPSDKFKRVPPSEVKPKQFPPSDVRGPKQFPPSDVRGSRQFPPPDVRKPKQFPPPDVRKKPKPAPVKRRIVDSDDDEYDSELDDFIDDGPDDAEDYSKHIKEIFGYDKSRYLDMDDDDDECMEANFAQVLKEEFVSTKLGILEDLEDIQKEQEEKKRKAMLKKRKIR